MDVLAARGTAHLPRAERHWHWSDHWNIEQLPSSIQAMSAHLSLCKGKQNRWQTTESTPNLVFAECRTRPGFVHWAHGSEGFGRYHHKLRWRSGAYHNMGAWRLVVPWRLVKAAYRWQGRSFTHMLAGVGHKCGADRIRASLTMAIVPSISHSFVCARMGKAALVFGRPRTS